MKTPPKSFAATFRNLAGKIAKSPQFIWYVCNDLPDSRKEFFEELYKPDPEPPDCGGGWWKLWDNEPRILALLLAAEIVERGGL